METETKKCWLQDEEEGYTLANVVELKGDMAFCRKINGEREIFQLPSKDVLFAEPRDHTPEDNCALINLNEATLLENVKQRYMKDEIYTYVANILIAVNPYYEIKGLYSKDTIKKYKGKSLGTLPPHPFAIADKAYRDMKMMKASQAIVVSGESGAGKTETTKHVLRYLTDVYGADAGVIEQRILDSNPLLEAFGNAKTVRNNNSSRFGKFIELSFDKTAAVCGGSIENYILEKGRLIRQSPNERNFHFFYQLFAGATNDQRKHLGLTKPDDFLHQENGYLHDISMDDLEDFRTSVAAMTEMGLDSENQNLIFSILAGILHLGNLEFQESKSVHGGCTIAMNSCSSLKKAAELLGIDEKIMSNALTNKVAGIPGLTIALRVEDTQNARDGLAKVIYDRLFELLVTTVNRAIPDANKATYIGLLDIAGFEHFEINSFEQFCINYCNEKLQQFFNERIFKDELEVYQREALAVQTVEYADNQDCIDLIEVKKTGILALLDEENRLPKCSSDHFTSEVHRVHGQSVRLMVPRKNKQFKHMLDNEGFLLQHFAGPVCYTTAEFIEKNNDALHKSLEQLLHSSTNDLLRKMHNPSETKTWTLKKLQSNIAGKINFISVGSKFRDQLNALIVKLKSTGTNFIRCVKPNSKMAAHEFEGLSCLEQLRFFGLTSVLVLMQQGFPSRTQFGDLYEGYKPLLTTDLRRLDPRMFFKALFHAVGMNDNDFKFGVSKVFFRAGKFAEFDELLRLDPANLNRMIDRVRKWILGYRWRRAIYATICAIKLREKIAYRGFALVTIQRFARGWLARKRVSYMIRVSRDLVSMKTDLVKLMRDYEEIPQFKAQGLASIDKVQRELEELSNRLRSGEMIAPSLLRANCEKLQSNVALVKSDFNNHRKLKEKTDEALRLQAQADAEGEIERRRKESERLLTEQENDLISVLQTPMVCQVPLISPSNGMQDSVFSQANGFSTLRTGTSMDSNSDGTLDIQVHKLIARIQTMSLKELKEMIFKTNSDAERRICEKEINRRYIALQEFKAANRNHNTTIQLNGSMSQKSH